MVAYAGKSDEAGGADARGVGDADRRDAAEVPHPRRGAGRGRRVRAAHRRADRPRGGQARGALPKIVEGRVNAFFKDFVLIEQPSVTDQKKTVKQVLAEAGIEVTRFVRFEVGQA